MAFEYPHYDFSLKHTQSYQDIKYALHRYLIARVEEDKVPVADWPESQLLEYVYNHVTDYANQRHFAVSSQDLDELTEEMVNELVGYGPLHALLEDDAISDIMVNGAYHVFYEKNGRVQESSLRFIDNEHVLRVLRRIIAPMGRRLDESSPMVDARLPDGSRVNAIIPPLAIDGPCVSIRKFRREMLRESDLLVYGSLSQDMLDLLTRAVRARCNIVVSGGTGTGKTTMLNVLSRFIDPAQRIVTIEDAAELQLGHSHVVRLETRPPNVEGTGEVRARDLVRNALRMRPDRIIVGEVRGEEVLDVLQAMNTGHDGSMSTVHANNTRDALVRLEMLSSLANFRGGTDVLREMIASAVDLVLHVTRFADGTRRITSIAEITGYRDGQFMLNELFNYDVQSNSFACNSMQASNIKFQHNGQAERGKQFD
ncbi:type II secretion system protein [Methylophaga lonarensis MPL]|uniref:Type II secretion system protein n=1 Tax=Methylophaga lonarensis MPL TaxID=1286106 RepID=M7PP41_9GAMM|nr:CpaF family protein [Methylophaga lonarensis]EMR12224.1 type II secretion system protein [Methylophaga lonarensis MPL]